MNKYLIKTNDMVYECVDLKSLKSKCNVLNELDLDFDIYILVTNLKYCNKLPSQLKFFLIKYGKY